MKGLTDPSGIVKSEGVKPDTQGPSMIDWFGTTLLGGGQRKEGTKGVRLDLLGGQAVGFNKFVAHK